MGTLVRPIPKGNECIDWGIPADTPEQLFSVFWEVSKGDRGGALEPPNLRIFPCYQHIGDACVFEIEPSPPDWCSQFGVQAIQCWLYLYQEYAPRRYYFAHTKAVAEPVEFELYTNIYQTPVNNYGYGGYGTTFWLERAIAIAVQFGWDHLDDLMLETVPIDAANVIHKFCSLTMRLNALIKFTP